MDRPLSLLGDYVVESSPQVSRGTQILLTEDAISEAIQFVLSIGR